MGNGFSYNEQISTADHSLVRAPHGKYLPRYVLWKNNILLAQLSHSDQILSAEWSPLSGELHDICWEFDHPLIQRFPTFFSSFIYIH